MNKVEKMAIPQQVFGLLETIQLEYFREERAEPHGGQRAIYLVLKEGGRPSGYVVTEDLPGPARTYAWYYFTDLADAFKFYSSPFPTEPPDERA